MAKDHVMSMPESSSPDIEGQGNRNPGSRGGFFEIHVKGHLDSNWSDWLEGMEVELLENGEMILCGPIVDQAALMGVLNKLSRLNLTILSLNKRNKKDALRESP